MIFLMITRTRNKILIAITLFSLLALITASVAASIQFYNNSINSPIQLIPENSISAATDKNLLSVFIAVFYFLLYVPSVLFFINMQFEKTQSTEIIYFSLFLTACLFEGVRLVIPLFNLWNDWAGLTAIISRIVLFARILGPISLLCIAVQNLPEHRQNTERNLLILIILSAICAWLMPVNSVDMLPSCRLKYGFEKLLEIFWIIITIVTFASMILNNFNSSIKSLIPLGFILTAFGYKLLCHSVNYLMAGSGIITITAGTFIFLGAIHKLYLWD